MLDIATQKHIKNQIFVIKLKGSIDTLSSSEFDDFFTGLLAKNNRFFILQAAQLVSLSSAGISSLVRFSKKINKLNGAAAFVGLAHEIELLLNFFALNKNLPLFNDMDSAVSWINKKIQSHPVVFEVQEEKVYAHKLSSQSSISIKERNQSHAISNNKLPEALARPLHSPFETEKIHIDDRAEQKKMHDIDLNKNLHSRNIQENIELRKIEPEVISGVDTNSDIDFFLPVQNNVNVAGMSQPQKPGHYLRSSLVKKCSACNLKLRYYRSGSHLCPGCGHVIKINSSDSCHSKRGNYES